jgi:hypothetical protein
MIDQSAPLTKPKSSHSLISTEPPDNGFTDYPNSTDLSFELRVATLANFSIQHSAFSRNLTILAKLSSPEQHQRSSVSASSSKPRSPLLYATLPTVPG